MLITINPTNPTSDDNVELVFTLTGCVEQINQVQADTTYELNVIFQGPCFATPPSFNYSWNIGRLGPGSYTASLNIGSNVAETHTFAVLQGVLPFPSSIPSVGFSGLVLLALAIGLIASKSIQKNINIGQ